LHLSTPLQMDGCKEGPPFSIHRHYLSIAGETGE